MNVKDILYETLEQFYPSRCAVCLKPLRKSILCGSCLPKPLSTTNRCQQCYSSLNFVSEDVQNLRCELCKLLPTYFSEERYLWDYKVEVKDLIHTLKYDPNYALCKKVGEISALEIPTLFSSTKWDYIVPIPSSLKNWKVRMFNPTGVIALEISNRISVPVKNLILHLKNNKSQAMRSQEDRLRRIKINIDKEIQIKECPYILLIDDVVTTGATSNAAALALIKKYNAEVSLFSLARSNRWETSRYAISRLYSSKG